MHYMINTKTEQANDWNGELYEKLFSFSPFNSSNPLQLLDPKPGEKILDFGCGTGELTAAINRRGADVVGLDPSQEMIRVAREQNPGLDFVAGGLETLGEENFDAIFSNDVLHWIPEPKTTLIRLQKKLRPGGRFVAEFAAAGNIRQIRSQLHELLAEFNHDPEKLDPWYFPTRNHYKDILESCDYEVKKINRFNQTAELPGCEGLRLWLELFAGEILSPLSPGEQKQLIDRLENQLRSDLFQDGSWNINYSRLRFLATRPKKPSLNTPLIFLN